MTGEWDPRKADANFRVHGVRFAEALTVLEDPYAITREDLSSVGEQRFVSLGLSVKTRLLVVVYAYRDPDAIRVISAWKANHRQECRYEEGRR